MQSASVATMLQAQKHKRYKSLVQRSQGYTPLCWGGGGSGMGKGSNGGRKRKERREKAAEKAEEVKEGSWNTNKRSSNPWKANQEEAPKKWGKLPL